MSLDNSTQQKADQISHRFFYKFAIVIDNARNVLTEPREDPKFDKWFNLETPDTDAYKDQLRLYKSISQLNVLPPPLDFEVLLTVPELTNNQVLVQHPPNQSRIRVDPTPTHVLLENWTLSFSTSPPVQSNSSTSEVSLATVYKHIMSVIRSLYTLLRFLPAWKICKRLHRRPRNSHLGIALRVRSRGAEASQSDDMRYLGFGSPLSAGSPALSTSTYSFQPVTHPMGIFSLTVTYLTSPHFEIDTVEALLSSRYFSLDTGPEFTPTLARNVQRESITGSPGSVSMRTSLPRSPPRDRTGLALGTGAPSSIADRFVIPGNAVASSSRTSLPGTSPRSRNVPSPAGGLVQRSISGQGTITSGSAGSVSSSSRMSREDGREALSSIARVRKESMGTGRGSGELSSTPGLRPFKSNVLSSGPASLRQVSPLTGPTLPSLPAGRAPSSPTSLRIAQIPFRSDSGASSPTGLNSPTLRAGSSPGTSLRPSPPTHLPSALGDRGERKFPASPGESGTSPEPSGIGMPPRRKRYSSSFGYRYNTTGSDGSAGSGDKSKEPERIGSASYLSNKNTDDDDITAFVEAIETAKPLGLGFKVSHDRERTLSEAGIAGRAVLSGGSFPSHIRLETKRASTSAQSIGFTSRHSRTMSENLGSKPYSTSPLFPGNDAGQPEMGLRTTEPMGIPSSRTDHSSTTIISQLDERIKEMNSKFSETLGLVERRSRLGDTGQPRKPDSNSTPSSPVTGPKFPFHQTGPETGHARSSSLGGNGPRPPNERTNSSPLSRQVQLDLDPVLPKSSPARRATSTSAAVHTDPRVENFSIWDNRRMRTRADSTGSGVSATSNISELERVRLFYTQGRAARESGLSISAGGSDEVVGRMDLDR